MNYLSSVIHQRLKIHQFYVLRKVFYAG